MYVFIYIQKSRCIAVEYTKIAGNVGIGNVEYTKIAGNVGIGNVDSHF